MSAHPDLFYFIDSSTSFSEAVRICVAACPDTDILDCSLDQAGCQAEGVCLSSPGSPYTNTTIDDCPEFSYISADSLHLHRCVPDDRGYLAKFYKNLNTDDTMQKVLADFAKSGLIILYCCIITLIVSVIVIFLMRCFAGIIIWTLMLSGAIALGALTVFFWVQWSEARDEDQELDTNSDNTKLWQALMIIFLVLTLIVVILIIALRNRINLCITIFKEASRAMARMPQIFLSPILNYSALGLLFAYWIWVYLYLSTSGDPVANTNGHVHWKQTNTNYRKMWWYHLFGLLWTSQFFLACGQFTLASMAAMWYFTREKSDLSWPLFRSMYRVLRYHFGSLVFGAFIIAVVQLARIILAYISAKLKGRAGIIVSILLCCLSCCLWCFEKCLKFLNKNAYIEIAIYGQSYFCLFFVSLIVAGSNFCVAAIRAVKTLLANVLRVAVINSIGTFVLFMIKLLIVCIIGILALAWLRVCFFRFRFVFDLCSTRVD
jgi:hypothetical protein